MASRQSSARRGSFSSDFYGAEAPEPLGGRVCSTTSPWQVICAAERTEIEWRKSANSPCGGQGTIWPAIREEETAKGKNNPGKPAAAGRRCQPFLVLLLFPKRFHCHPLLWIWKGLERWKGCLMVVGISKVGSLKQCSPFLKASHDQLFKGKIWFKSSLFMLRKLNELTLLSCERREPEETRQVNQMWCLVSCSSDISSWCRQSAGDSNRERRKEAVQVILPVPLSEVYVQRRRAGTTEIASIRMC